MNGARRSQGEGRCSSSHRLRPASQRHKNTSVMATEWSCSWSERTLKPQKESLHVCLPQQVNQPLLPKELKRHGGKKRLPLESLSDQWRRKRKNSAVLSEKQALSQ